ncbi:MAG: exodeoxyribonuclease VII large subunit [Angelakisella sp.]
MAQTIVTVSQLCRFVKSLLEEQKPLSDILVKGEISNLSLRSASGHLYFSLLDGESCIRCVMFSHYAQSLRTLPEEGSLAVARGTVNLYERDGSFQLITYDLQELGAGAQQKTLEQLKKQLQGEGLFAAQRKRAFPLFPAAVGVITSPDGAALQDIIATFRKHNPLVKLIVYPATVQGVGAAASVMAALRQMQQEALCQSCVIARGGGSSEDLSAFDNEALARMVGACAVPVVSAVGHEIDYSIVDLVADARAATPTAACQLLSAPITRLTDRLLRGQQQLTQQMQTKLRRYGDRVERLSLQLGARSPQSELKKNRQTLSFLVKSLENKQQLIIERLSRRATAALNQLELVNPAQLLRRGYSITSGSGGVISSCSQLHLGDIVTTRLTDGCIRSTVTSVNKEASS